MDRCHREPARDTPVLGEYDVVVCGAGAAGCAAAVAAARHGARTLLVERDGFLGGATVSQLVAHVLSTNACDFQGVWHEWAAQVAKRGGLAAPDLVGGPGHYRLGVDPEVVKYAWDDLVSAAGAAILHHAWVSDCIVRDGSAAGVVAETRAGRRAILARRVIDCTGDGAVCAAAGVPWEQGDGGGHPWSQALTMVFRMGNVHWPEQGYQPAQLAQAQRALDEGLARGEFSCPVVANGRALHYSANNAVHRSVAPCRPEMNVFASRVLRVDPLDPWDFTRAVREGRAQAWECATFIRRCVPGFEAAYLLDTAQHIGVRDSRRIRGRATLTADDVWHLRQHTDGIARVSWDIDIWPPESYSAPAVPHQEPAYQERGARVKQGACADVPYGCLVAEGIDNLLMAGRCLSAERRAQASIRIQQTCQATGQAAGTAAALSLRESVTPAALDARRLVARLAADRDAVTPALPTLVRLSHTAPPRHR